MNVKKVDFAEAGDSVKRLEQIGWGIFLMMTGAIWLVPGVPQGTWLIGTGLLLLALNAIGSWLGNSWSFVTTGLGLLVLIAGLGHLTGIDLPIFPICLVILGAFLILKPLLSQRA